MNERNTSTVDIDLDYAHPVPSPDLADRARSRGRSYRRRRRAGGAAATIAALAVTIPLGVHFTAGGPAATVQELAPAQSRKAQPAPTITVHNCGDGLTQTLIVPEPNFDPLAATPADLEENGYPPRPSAAEAEDFTVWLHYVRHPIHRIGCAGMHLVHPGEPGWVDRGEKYVGTHE